MLAILPLIPCYLSHVIPCFTMLTFIFQMYLRYSEMVHHIVPIHPDISWRFTRWNQSADTSHHPPTWVQHRTAAHGHCMALIELVGASQSGHWCCCSSPFHQRISLQSSSIVRSFSVPTKSGYDLSFLRIFQPDVAGYLQPPHWQSGRNQMTRNLLNRSGRFYHSNLVCVLNRVD